MLNTVNRGFTAGNDDGIRAASGSFLVLLNNDTQVSEGWLTGLRTSLQEDSSIGLVGPVSNAVGNEQKISTSGVTPAEILAEGAAWVRHSRGDTFETERLGFFCVALRRETADKAGLLDEAFDLGNYADDDYCLRMLKAGYRLICREDIFVYHRGSSFVREDPSENQGTLEENLRLLERKYGIRSLPVIREIVSSTSWSRIFRRASIPEARNPGGSRSRTGCGSSKNGCRADSSNGGDLSAGCDLSCQISRSFRSYGLPLRIPDD